ncbi:MAG: Miniconductance mechanosensitive channel YbdG [Chlamydiia bacterium]|nr:Miniconductance mechanosensitive channel YbdG [Chlamydiia bacterium]
MNFISHLLTMWGIKTSFIPILSFIIAFSIIIAIAYFAHILFKIYLHRRINKLFEKKSLHWGKSIIEANLVRRLSHLVPALIIYTTVPLLNAPSLSIDVTIIRFIQAIMLLYILGAFVLVFNSVITIAEDVYKKQRGKKRKPIKSYVQVIRIIVYFFSAILAVSIIINRSPIALFTGLGVIAAGITFVFKDTITGFITSIQVSSYDMVRVGDWIVLPKYDTDGDVIEISLNTVKIQNFDKTITTLPTNALLSEGMTNWRGMQEAGGRRIKRSILIDLKTIRFCDNELLSKLTHVPYMKKAIESLEESSFEGRSRIKTLSKTTLTNLGLFRAYIESYLTNHPKIHQEFTFLVRHLDPTEYGLPLQIYIFTNDTNWNHYEDIQSDIFEHLFSIIQKFDLQIYQRK